MIRLYLAVFLTLASCTSTHAQSLKLPLTVFAAAGTADMATTLVAQDLFGVRDSRGRLIMREGNPLVSWISNPKMMVAVGAAGEAALTYLLTKRLKNHPKLLTISLYAASTAHITFAIRNHQLNRSLGR